MEFQLSRFAALSLVYALGSLLLYAVYRAVYNYYFHPLRVFPGPFWASISDFFKLWLFSTKQAHTIVHEYHARYGPVVRIAPNLLSINDPKLLPTVYHRHVDKTDFYTPAILGEIPPPFQTLAHKEHARKRKRVAPSFSLSNLVRLEGQVDERVTEWTSLLRRRFADTGAGLDFAAWTQWFAYDTICQLSFGEPLGFVREGRDVWNLIANFHDMATLAAVVAALPWLCAPILESRLGKWLFMPKPGDNSGTGKIMKFRDDLLEDRFRNPKDHHTGDFLDNILSAKNEDGSPISIDEVKTECFVLMVAASDTTAAFFCGFLRYVVLTPGVYEKLVAEIDDFDRRSLLSNPVASFSEIKKLPYFAACHRETSRFQPSTPMILPRYVSEGGLDLYGKHVPQGTEIGANPYIIHRDKSVFGEDADCFRPERWLENPEREKEMERYLLSWGYGTRICIGKNVALLETYKLLLQFFRLFKPTIDDVKVCRQENLALLVHWDMWIHITTRESSFQPRHAAPSGSEDVASAAVSG